MSILIELQTKKLGLMELLSMGFEVYLRNFKFILMVYLTTSLLPTVFFISLTDLQKLGLLPIGTYSILSLICNFILFFSNCIYGILISVITEHSVLGQKIKYRNLLKILLSNFMTLMCLNIKFIIIYSFRLLLLIPGLIYLVNNAYFGLAFILRDQRGKAAFAYSRHIVKGNWWKVFFFYILIFFVASGLPIILTKIFNLIPFINSFEVSLLSYTLSGIVSIGPGIGGILLFLNLDYCKSSKGE